MGPSGSELMAKGSTLNAGGYGLRPGGPPVASAAANQPAPRERAHSAGGGLHSRMEGGVWITTRGAPPSAGGLQPQGTGPQRMLGNAAITGTAVASAGACDPARCALSVGGNYYTASA